MTAGALRVVEFEAAGQPELLRRCQRLRYEVYHHDLGLDMDDLDHGQRLDVEARDGVCDFAAVVDADERVLGCIRMQPPGRGPYYAELEFSLIGPSWSERPLVEGARFAVTAAERGGPVPLLLFQAFRRYCRGRGVDEILSVAILRGDPSDRRRCARLTRFLVDRARYAPERGAPAPGYEVEPPTADELRAADPPGAAELSPMLRLLAGPRTTLCSPPAYCHRFGTFNFLLTTRLS